MHERPLMRGIVEMVLAEAESCHAVAVESVELQISQFSELTPSQAESLFRACGTDPLLSHTKLRFSKVPNRVACACGEVTKPPIVNRFPRAALKFPCPSCGKPLTVLGTPEFTVTNLELEVPHV